MQWNHVKYWMHLHIGKLGESSLKHRSAILLLSVLMLFIEPSVTITFGNASLAGLGISFNPPQTISIGLFLFALLIYRLTAFWVSVFLESGTDSKRATRKALLSFDPSYEAEENRPHNMEHVIKAESEDILYKWSVRQILWEFVTPNLLAIVSLSVYIIEYLA